MTTFRAGVGRSDITPHIGGRLTGYGNRASGSTGVHDPLICRALVVEDPEGRYALLSVEMCYLNADSVREIRDAIERRCAIPAGHIFVATTHTHSGPHDRETENWLRPLAELAADAAQAACAQLAPAQLGSGFGLLPGHGINRRWLDRPVDPALGVIRVDRMDGSTLALVTVFANHAVVLGSDNLLISGDWPGYASRQLEAALGGDATVLFFQGGSANVNPVTAGVRARLDAGEAVGAIGDVSVYYGDKAIWNIGNRQGGTFDEAAELARRFGAEVQRVARGIIPQELSIPLMARQLVVPAAAENAVQQEPEWLAWVTEDADALLAAGIPAEIMLLRLGDALLVGQPGEVFSETAVRLRTRLRQQGVATPLTVSYANGWLAYLPEAEDFAEGGYEVTWPRRLGIREDFQPAVRSAIDAFWA